MDTEVQPAPATEAVSDDVHADVRAAFESLSKPTDAAEAAPTERARDEAGKFAPKDELQQADKVSDVDPAEGKPQQPSPAVEAPTSWSADAKAKWSSLDPSIQAEIVRREQNMHEGGQKWSEEKKRYEELVSPVREAAKRNGIDETEGIKRLMAAQDYLDRDPVSALQWLAQAYGVDLQNMTATQQARPQADPMLSQLNQKVSYLEETLQQQAQKELQAQVDAFKSQPGREHFEEVKKTMGNLLMSGLAQDLAEAYDKAVWQTPSVREKLIAAQTANQQSAADKAKQQAAQAKKAALSLSGSPTSGAAPVPKQDYETVDDAARAAARAHGWNV